MHHLSDAHRVNLSGSATPDTTLATIEGNYIHNTIMWDPDPAMARKDNKTHSDSLVQLEGGTNIRIIGNRSTGLHSTDGTSTVQRTTTTQPFIPVTTGGMLYHVTTSSIMVSPNAGWTIKNVTINNNWLGGGEESPITDPTTSSAPPPSATTPSTAPHSKTCPSGPKHPPASPKPATPTPTAPTSNTHHHPPLPAPPASPGGRRTPTTPSRKHTTLRSTHDEGPAGNAIAFPAGPVSFVVRFQPASVCRYLP